MFLLLVISVTIVVKYFTFGKMSVIKYEVIISSFLISLKLKLRVKRSTRISIIS